MPSEGLVFAGHTAGPGKSRKKKKHPVLACVDWRGEKSTPRDGGGWETFTKDVTFGSDLEGQIMIFQVEEGQEPGAHGCMPVLPMYEYGYLSLYDRKAVSAMQLLSKQEDFKARQVLETGLPVLFGVVTMTKCKAEIPRPACAPELPVVCSRFGFHSHFLAPPFMYPDLVTGFGAP